MYEKASLIWRLLNSHLAHIRYPLLQLLLRPQLVGVSALLLPAVGRSGRKACIALPADHLVAVVLRRESFQGRLDDPTT